MIIKSSTGVVIDLTREIKSNGEIIDLSKVNPVGEINSASIKNEESEKTDWFLDIASYLNVGSYESN